MSRIIFLNCKNATFLLFLTALEHIKSGGLSPTTKLPENPSSSALSPPSRTLKSGYRTTSSGLEELFCAVVDSDVASAKAILERSSSDFPDSVGDVMCHPLCTCSKCSDVSFSTNGVPAQRKRSVVSLTQVVLK